MGRSANIFIIVLVAAAWLISMSVFTVREDELAIKFRLGEFEHADYQPGIHLKMPFFNNVRKFERRIITLDAEPERYLTLEKKNVIVDSFVKWRIADVESYYKSTGGDEAQASLRLAQIIKEGLRGEFGKRTIQEAISGERTEIMQIITDEIAKRAHRFGVEVVDVRIKRIELPREVSSSVYRRMEAERARVAKELRSEGAEIAEKIRAEADRKRSEILAEAYSTSERIRGEGDGKAAEIYAKAYGQDEQFYELYRSLNAYRNVFSKQEDVLVLDPDSEFFKYFGSASGNK